MILGQALFSFHLIPSEVLQAQAQRKKIVCIKTGVIKEPSPFGPNITFIIQLFISDDMETHLLNISCSNR